MSGNTRIVHYVVYARALVIMLVLATSACAGQKPEVIVVGTLHQLHQEATYYSFSDLRRIILALKPDVLCVELQPQDLTARPEEKNKREYPEVIYPLIDAGHYRVYAMEPSEPMFSEVVQSIGRANQAFRDEQQEAAKRLDAFIDSTYALLASYWKSPAAVNDAFTDEVFAAKHAAQGRLIGKCEADGWTAWNEHFLSVIRKAADENPGKRILVLVGAEHGYWLRQRLRSDRRLHVADAASLLDWLAPAEMVRGAKSK